jgi:hypothetical protein
MSWISNSARHLEIVLICMPLGFCLQLIPFQHYISLSRFQHFSFTIFFCAAGFLLQAIYSWKRIKLAGRITLLGTASYLLAAGLVLYLNPWMDAEGAMNSELQIEFRQQMACLFFFAGLPVAGSWFAWAIEKANTMLPPGEQVSGTVSEVKSQ